MTPSKKPAARPAAAKAPKGQRAKGGTTKGGTAKGDGTKGTLPKPAWDISDIDEWGPSRHELGATIPEAGNSIYNETGGWRTFVPEIDIDKCIGCMLCYFYCPDAAIIVEGGKAVAVDLAHCKGCGICAHECPPKAITMLLEEKE
jgi:2-oxoacid:acceptor oxidoreductase delta subunit (pyruvate/2-ketoisovalerate family)